MAYASTLFWTKYGFDGSEEQSRVSRHLYTVPPEHNRLELLSAASSITITATLQGAGFLYSLGASLNGEGDWSSEISLPSIFQPLTFLSLPRLFACLWLSDNDHFVNTYNTEDTGQGTGIVLSSLNTRYEFGPDGQGLLQPSANFKAGVKSINQ